MESNNVSFNIRILIQYILYILQQQTGKKRKYNELVDSTYQIKQTNVKSESFNHEKLTNSEYAHGKNNPKLKRQKLNRKNRANNNGNKCNSNWSSGESSKETTQSPTDLEFGQYYKKFERSINNLKKLNLKQKRTIENKHNDINDASDVNDVNDDTSSKMDISNSKHRKVRSSSAHSLRNYDTKAVRRQLKRLQNIKRDSGDSESEKSSSCQLRSKSWGYRASIRSSHASSLRQLREKLQKANYLLDNGHSLSSLS